MRIHFFTAPFLLAGNPHCHFSFHPPPEHVRKSCHVERLGDVLVHAGILGTDDVFGEGIRRHGEDRKCFGIPLGKAAIRECRFSRIVRANTGYVENNDGQSLPRVGKVASGASRIGF